MNFKLLKYAERYESVCFDANQMVWHTAIWGLDLDPAMIKREALLLADDAKRIATYIPEEVVIPEPVATKPSK